MLRPGEVEAVKVHYLVPRRYEVVQELLLGVLASVDFRQRPKLRVRTEDKVDTSTALAVGIEIGLFSMVGTLGGIFVTVPSMLFWYVPTGIIEGVVASALIVSLSKLNGVKLFGLELSRKNDHAQQKDFDVETAL